jgi:transposase-like protein
MKRKQRTRCKLCARPALRRAIDFELRTGASQQAIAREFEVAQSLIHRHMKCRHVRLAGDDYPAKVEQLARWLEFFADQLRQLRIIAPGSEQKL